MKNNHQERMRVGYRAKSSPLSFTRGGLGWGMEQNPVP